jgi:CheY-like chemotaxis protein
MTGMDGWAAAARLRQLCTSAQARQPVLVMVSGNSREALEQRTQEEQSMLNGFLVKPVTASMLLEAALESAASNARIRQSQRSAANLRSLRGMRILVVEDNLINQQVAEELLMSEGALVSLAANGQLGVDAIAAAMTGAQFDAVLMDIQMPVMDGFAATRCVREQLHLASLPIIAMTANAMASDREDCLLAGMNAHVGKPFDLKALVQTLLDVTGYQAPHGTAAMRNIPGAPALPPTAAASSVLDVAAALNRMGGLTRLYLRSARDFLGMLPQQVRALQAASASDAAQCGRLAHALKGTASLLGAMALSEVASHLEKQCNAGAAGPTLATTLERLDVLARATEAELLQVLSSMQGADDPALHGSGSAASKPTAPGAASETAHAAIRAALEQLTPQLEANDLTALETFATLRETLVAMPAALFTPLEEALQDLELEQAHAACRNIRTWLDALATHAG